MRSIAGKLAIGMALTAVAMFAADSSLGTWKWNSAKSKITVASANPLKSRTDAWEATADGAVKVTRTEERADGTTFNFSYTFRYDGKEYPVTGAAFDFFSAKRINANTTVWQVRKAGGKYDQTIRDVVSKDGKTRTWTITGAEAGGNPVHVIYVYDKQ